MFHSSNSVVVCCLRRVTRHSLLLPFFFRQPHDPQLKSGRRAVSSSLSVLSSASGGVCVVDELARICCIQDTHLGVLKRFTRTKVVKWTRKELSFCVAWMRVCVDCGGGGWGKTTNLYSSFNSVRCSPVLTRSYAWSYAGATHVSRASLRSAARRLGGSAHSTSPFSARSNCATLLALILPTFSSSRP